MLSSVNQRNQLREARKAKGLTQTELAKQIGTTQAMLGRYEANQVEPSIGRALAIARVLDRPVEELFSEAQ